MIVSPLLSIFCTKAISFDDDCQTPFLKVKSQKKRDRKERKKNEPKVTETLEIDMTYDLKTYSV